MTLPTLPATLPTPPGHAPGTGTVPSPSDPARKCLYGTPGHAGTTQPHNPPNQPQETTNMPADPARSSHSLPSPSLGARMMRGKPVGGSWGQGFADIALTSPVGGWSDLRVRVGRGSAGPKVGAR